MQKRRPIPVLHVNRHQNLCDDNLRQMTSLLQHAGAWPVSLQGRPSLMGLPLSRTAGLSCGLSAPVLARD